MPVVPPERMRTYVRDDAPGLPPRRRHASSAPRARLTIDEIAERLALPRGRRSTTGCGIFRSIAQSGQSASAAQPMATQAMQAKYRLAREAAYADGRATFDVARGRPLVPRLRLPLSRGGLQARPQRVSVCNSDPAVVRLCDAWLRRLSQAPHLSHPVPRGSGPDELREFWARRTRDRSGTRSACSGSPTATSWRAGPGAPYTACSPSASTTRCCAPAWAAGWTASASPGLRLAPFGV